ncbi:hypothetical protein CRE_09772 [Caenorhabditis remanei]|uniref:UBC core domain-containing protein n=1 Tax=Caenorhabditis remanei TaxID=31234 RepID=E3N9X6_CAERE|nr:hypothetical protein CRE_09772 [Caenorhabditis remanei]
MAIALFRYAPPHTEYIITVNIPKTYPFTPPILVCKKDPKIKLKFLEKSQWKPSIGIREVLIEACHVISRRDLSSRLPVLPRLRPPLLKPRGSRSPPKKQ